MNYSTYPVFVILITCYVTICSMRFPCKFELEISPDTHFPVKCPSAKLMFVIPLIKFDQ